MLSRIINTIIHYVLRTNIKEKKRQFDRILPFGDYFIDRWEKAKIAGAGGQSSIYDSCLILGNVEIGKKCWIGPYTILDGSGAKLSIGDNSVVSAGSHIYTHDTVQNVLSGSPVSISPVSIGKHTYIGPNSVISSGVKIGDFVIIGANSFVNKDIPSYSKAFGTPAKVVEKIEIEDV